MTGPDVSGDGHADIVTANSGRADLSLLLGAGAGGSLRWSRPT
ncbi:MAG: hypothetical protein ACHP7D_12110 [Lysobacterales bacterium]